MRFVPPGNSSKEIVKVKVERCVGTRSFEVVTEDGARYRRNRRHLRKTKEAYRSPKPGLAAEGDTDHCPCLNEHRLVMSSQPRAADKRTQWCGDI